MRVAHSTSCCRLGHLDPDVLSRAVASSWIRKLTDEKLFLPASKRATWPHSTNRCKQASGELLHRIDASGNGYFSCFRKSCLPWHLAKVAERDEGANPYFGITAGR
jgi:hypothetical protein